MKYDRSLGGFVSSNEFARTYNLPYSTVRNHMRTGKCDIPIENSYGKNHILYSTWKSMRTRCYDRGYRDFKHYGGRGIKMCGRWYYSFNKFIQDMGDRPEGMSIDRENNDLGYSPENCRWATSSQQNSNKRQRVRPTEGRTKCEIPLGSNLKYISWHKGSRLWRVRAPYHKVLYFKTIEEAITHKETL